MSIRTKFATRTLGLMLLASAAVGVASTQTTASAPPTPLDQCVTEYADGDRTSLNPGQSRRVVNGVTVVGGRSATAKVTRGPKAGQGVIALGDDSNAEAMAEEYAAQGRSVLDDARAAGVGRGGIKRLCERALADGPLELSATSGSGRLYDSACAADSSGKVEWDACVERYRTTESDPDWNYGVDSAYAWGHETSRWAWLELTVGGVKNNYGSNYLDMVKTSPGSDISDVDRCYNHTFGASAGGFGVTQGGTICPAKWDVTRTDNYGTPVYHRVEWKGKSHDDREALALTSYRIRPNRSTLYSLGYNWKVS